MEAIAEIATAEISVESLRLDELFNRKLVIPDYQRPYVWKTSDIKKLLNQIATHQARDFSHKPMFYLGSIVLHHDLENDELNIIDGQQRLTTLALIEYFTSGRDSTMVYRNAVSQGNIKQNFTFLQEHRQKLSNINFSEINVTVITTTSLDDAYTFFETINTGGVRLSGVDIIKAHHIKTVSRDQLDICASAWEQQQKHLHKLIQFIIKARRWSAWSKYNEVPSRRATKEEWKKIITGELSENTGKNNKDISYAVFASYKDTLRKVGTSYAIRQPLEDGENVIQYLLSNANIYRKLFVAEEMVKCPIYRQLHYQMIEPIDGTVDLKALYQLGLFCYVSKFGFDRLAEAALWIFCFVYNLRLSAKSRLQETAVINHCRDHFFLDRILAAFKEEELFEWWKNQGCEANEEALSGVKGRYVKRLEDHFQIDGNRGIQSIDQQLKERIKSILQSNKWNNL